MKIGSFVGLELDMLADAIEQYVQNTEEIEHELELREMAKLNCARELSEKIAARMSGVEA